MDLNEWWPAQTKQAAVRERIFVRSPALRQGVCDTTNRNTQLVGIACRGAASRPSRIEVQTSCTDMNEMRWRNTVITSSARSLGRHRKWRPQEWVVRPMFCTT